MQDVGILSQLLHGIPLTLHGLQARELILNLLFLSLLSQLVRRDLKL